MRSEEKFMFANCYKLIACDPTDQLVLEACSLKQGVASLIIANETSRKLKRLRREKQMEHAFTPILNPIEIDVMFDQFS